MDKIRTIKAIDENLQTAIDVATEEFNVFVRAKRGMGRNFAFAVVGISVQTLDEKWTEDYSYSGGDVEVKHKYTHILTVLYRD